MKAFLIACILLVAVAAGVFLFSRAEIPRLLETDLRSVNQQTMNIKSAAFENQALIASTYTCDGENINPPLAISGAPEGAKSLALISDDPDAPGGTWVHWTLWNIDPRTSEIAENSVPEKAVEGTTSFGKSGYGGPCPPSGTHRYYFKLYALDTILNIPPTATASDLKEAMRGHILADARLVGTYSR